MQSFDLFTDFNVLSYSNNKKNKNNKNQYMVSHFLLFLLIECTIPIAVKAAYQTILLIAINILSITFLTLTQPVFLIKEFLFSHNYVHVSKFN